MADAGFALQKAVYAALDSALSCPVYDHVPDGATYPYVVIDSQLADDQQRLNAGQERVMVYLSVWSTYSGQKEVLEIMGTIKDTLQNNRLTLTTGTVSGAVVRRKSTSRDVDGKTYTGHITLEYVIDI